MTTGLRFCDMFHGASREVPHQSAWDVYSVDGQNWTADSSSTREILEGEFYRRALIWLIFSHYWGQYNQATGYSMTTVLADAQSEWLKPKSTWGRLLTQRDWVMCSTIFKTSFGAKRMLVGWIVRKLAHQFRFVPVKDGNVSRWLASTSVTVPCYYTLILFER